MEHRRYNLTGDVTLFGVCGGVQESVEPHDASAHPQQVGLRRALHHAGESPTPLALRLP